MWINQISPDELFEACRELEYLKNSRPKSEDKVLAAVRDNMTTVVTIPPRGTSMGVPKREFDEDGNPLDHWLDKHYSEQRHIVPDKEKRADLDTKISKYWELVKKEIRLLLRTKDRKYTKLRKDLNTYGENSKHTIVALVSAGIGQSLGIAGGVITGLVAIVLFAVVKIGISAYCTSTCH